MYVKLETNRQGLITISQLAIKKIIMQVILDSFAKKVNLSDIEIKLNNTQLSLFINLNINNKNINIYQYANKINEQLNRALKNTLNFQIKNIHTIFNN